MKLKSLFLIGAGAVTGAYVADRWRRNLATEPPALRDGEGHALRPTLVELAGGEPVPVFEAGEGPVVVSVPGLSGDPEVFRFQIAALVSAGYRVLAPSLREDYDGVERDFNQFAHDIAAVLDAFGVASACLFGLSFGGPIAIRFATLYPERTWGLVLTATLARLDLSHVGFNRTLLIPIARISTRFAPVALMRRLADVWGRWGIWVYDPSPGNERILDYELESPARVPSWVGTSRMGTFKGIDLREELRAIEQPALVIAGSVDSYTPLAWQKEIAELLPKAAFVEIPAGGHLSLISHADTFNRVVLDWLAETRPSRRPSRASPSAN